MKIELSGGIGNQLFQYSFGKHWERKHHVQVSYLLAPHGKDEEIHNSGLNNFLFEENLILTKRNRISASIARIDRYMTRKFPFYREVSIKFLYRYSQIETGFDQEITNFRKLKLVRGYFQSYRYPEFSKHELISLFELKTTSNEYDDYEKQAKQILPIMVHLRRGDYVKLSNSFGILGVDYYYNAIKFLLESNPGSEVWIFSDDSLESSQMQSQLELMGITGVKSGFSLSDSETLKLMSLGAAIVIANSTFSWWAAYLGNYSNKVVAPLKWYKTLPDPVGLIPKNWKQIESHWVTN